MLQRKDTVYSKLNAIAEIEDPVARKAALRQALTQDNLLAVVVQRTYHPNYNFNLPKGELPSIARKSNHDEPGPFMQSVKKWDIFRPSTEVPYNNGIDKHVVEAQFIALYEAVASDDADLLVGVKDKKLPWDSLNAEFVVDAIPELFPDSFRPNNKVETSEGDVQPTNNQESPKLDSSKGSAKDQCIRIMQENPGLKRKEYLERFQALGVKKATASIYYQELKDKF